MKRNCFTLIEMLVVIGLIAILAGLAFPALNSARRKAKENAAVAGCNTLATAIKQYHMTYSKYPVYYNSAVKTVDFGRSDTEAATPKGGYSSDIDIYDNLMSTLVGIKPGGSDFNDWTKVNARKIRFLEPSQDYMKSGSSFLNPWGARYYIVWNDKGYSTLKFHRAKDKAITSASKDEITLLTDVAVFSELDPNSGAEFSKRLATSWSGVKTF